MQDKQVKLLDNKKNVNDTLASIEQSKKHSYLDIWLSYLDICHIYLDIWTNITHIYQSLLLYQKITSYNKDLNSLNPHGPLYFSEINYKLKNIINPIYY